MRLTGRILRCGMPFMALGILLIGLLVFAPTQRASACWNTELIECFNQSPLPLCVGGWPFQSPPSSGRYWRHWPNPPYNPNSTNMAWGFEHDIFDDHMCPEDQTALWCIGCPPSNDPEVNQYTRNLDTYVVYGPISLTQAEAAVFDFYLYAQMETAHDSVYWGGATTYNLSTPSTMNIGGRYSGIMESDWQLFTCDLSNLRNAATGDSMSMLGQSTVYVFWRFKADNNTVVDLGAFLDNVTIAWDDGGVDLQALSTTLLRLDDSTGVVAPQIGDSIFCSFEWSACTGGVGIYPSFRVIGTLDGSMVILDTVLTGVTEGQTGTLYTDWWEIDQADSHFVRIVLDTLNEVDESNEDNNVGHTAYWLEPPNPAPIFIWVSPFDSTIHADTVAVLRWECYDPPPDEASLIFKTDNNSEGCVGILMPGGVRTEHDGPDSLLWDVHNAQLGTYYPFVLVSDGVNDTCIYAPYPIVVFRTDASDARAGIIPEEFYLEQNYPNPFNPKTDIRFGMAVGGAVTLTVYDLLGRTVNRLVDDTRAPGSYAVKFDGTQFAAGVYLYTLTTPEGTITRKMMLLK